MTTSGKTSDNEWQRVTANDNEWYNEWQWVKTTGATSGNRWQRMTKSDSEWQQMTTNDNEWQRMKTSGTMNENEWKRISASKKEWFWFQNETKYAMYNYNMFRNIDYLKIGKLMTYIFNIIFCVSSCSCISSYFLQSFFLKFIKAY